MDLRLPGFCAIGVHIFQHVFQPSLNIFQENISLLLGKCWREHLYILLPICSPSAGGCWRRPLWVGSYFSRHWVLKRPIDKTILHAGSSTQHPATQYTRHTRHHMPHTIPPTSTCILTQCTFSICVYCSVVLRLFLSPPICRVLFSSMGEVRYMEYRYNCSVHSKDFRTDSRDFYVFIRPHHTTPHQATPHYATLQHPNTQIQV